MAKVLVIDDDAGLLQMVKLMLEREGHTAILAQGGEAGLLAAQTQEPEIAIVDLMMPGISGYDVTRQLRGNPSTARIPVLILTARSQPMDKQMAINAGATAFMSKPVSSRELTTRIAEILANPATGANTGPARTDAPIYSNQPPPPPSSGTTRRVPIGVEAAPAPTAPAAPQIRKPARQVPLTAVLGLRPGVGATTVGVNLTFLLRRTAERVCLVDLALSNGQVGAQLHLAMRTSWADLLAVGENLDVRAVSAVITPHPQAGVGIIGAPGTRPPRPLSLDATVQMFSTLGSGFQQIVADVSPANSSLAAVLAIAKTIIVVVGDDMNAAQNPFNLPQVFSGYGVNLSSVRLVVNHSQPEPGVPLQAISKAYNMPITLELPYDVNQAQAVRRGVPAAIMSPESPFAQALAALIKLL